MAKCFISQAKCTSSILHIKIMLEATELPTHEAFQHNNKTYNRKYTTTVATPSLLLYLVTKIHHQIAAWPCVSNGRPKDMSPTSTHIAALTYIGTAVNPVCEAIKLAHSPPNLNNVAAVPVPVPRCGPGNDSGVNAYMMAYSDHINTIINGQMR